MRIPSPGHASVVPVSHSGQTACRWFGTCCLLGWQRPWIRGGAWCRCRLFAFSPLSRAPVPLADPPVRPLWLTHAYAGRSGARRRSARRRRRARSAARRRSGARRGGRRRSGGARTRSAGTAAAAPAAAAAVPTRTELATHDGRGAAAPLACHCRCPSAGLPYQLPRLPSAHAALLLASPSACLMRDNPAHGCCGLTWAPWMPLATLSWQLPLPAFRVSPMPASLRHTP